MLGLNLCDLTGLRVSCFAASCRCRRLHIPCRSLVTFANTLWIPSSTSRGTRSRRLGNWMAPRKIRVWVQKWTNKKLLSWWVSSSSFIPNRFLSLQCSAYTSRLVYKLCSSFCHQCRQDYQNFLDNLDMWKLVSKRTVNPLSPESTGLPM